VYGRTRSGAEWMNEPAVLSLRPAAYRKALTEMAGLRYHRT